MHPRKLAASLAEEPGDAALSTPSPRGLWTGSSDVTLQAELGRKRSGLGHLNTHEEAAAAAALREDEWEFEGFDDHPFPWDPEDPAIEYGEGPSGDPASLAQAGWADEEMSLEQQVELFGDLP